MIDVDAFIERAAIMEFDGSMSRFRAETLAAQAQGAQRREALDEIGRRNSQGQRNIGEVARGSCEDDMPTMQSASKEENRPMPERQPSIGRSGVELPSLRT